MEPEMEEQLLVTMKTVCAFFEKQRKIQKYAWVFLAIFIPAVVAIPLTIEYRKSKQRDAAKADLENPDNWTWCDVREDDRRGNYKRAIEKAKYLIKKAPNSPGDNHTLARLYLDVGDLKLARKYYQKAYDLWPCEVRKKLLDVLDKLEGKEKLPTNKDRLVDE
jgi:tetratricopeptide (TPR) repeat protein